MKTEKMSSIFLKAPQNASQWTLNSNVKDFFFYHQIQSFDSFHFFIVTYQHSLLGTHMLK